MQIERDQSPEIPIEQLSQQILTLLTKVYERELSQSYNFKAGNEFYTASQKQAKLIQFTFLTSVSAIGLGLSALLLVRQRNRGITWNMTGLCFLPEECVGELDTLYEGLKSEEKAIWTIRLIMLWNILVLLKSLYIQVAIEDLFLPSKNKRD